MRTQILRIGICLLGLLAVCGVNAQNQVFPVQVRDYPLINPTVYLSDLSDMPFNALRPMYELTLRDPVELSREVYFRVTIVENGVEIMRTNPNAMGLPRFTLTRGVPRLITGMDLAPYFDLNNLVGRSGLSNSNLLKPGMNSVCLEVMDVQRQEPISAKRCASGFWSLLDPPLLALPNNNATIASADLASQLFTWQMTDPRAGAQSGVKQEILFDFELRELPVGMNPQDAFDNFIQIYTISDQVNYLLFYNQLAPLLEPDKTYAWRVRAKRVERGQALPGYFKNNGFSMVHTFKVTGGTEGTPAPGNAPGCACEGANCTPSIIADQTAVRSISPDQILKMGFFQVNNLKLTNSSGASLSGTGMVLIGFMDFKIKVRFDGLQVNTKGEVFGGVIRVDRNAASSLAVQAADGLFSGIPLLTEADKQFLNSIVESSIGEVPELPFSIRKSLEKANIPALEGQGDLIVSDMYFSPQGAFMDLIAVIPDGNGGYVRFGASKVGIRPDGIDMSQLILFLADDLQLPGLGDVPLYIKKSVSSDSTRGSYMAFDCTGFKQFNLVAEYIFPKEQLVRAEEPFEEAVKAKLVLHASQWGQFIATASIPNFKLADAPEWSFEVKKATMDLDSTRNVDRMVFPTFYAGEEEVSWKGFYVEQLSVTLPPEFRFGDSSQEGIKISANNLMIDTSGVSGDLFASNVIDFDEAENGWGFSLDTIGVYFTENAFQAATIKGGAKVGILGADIQYEGILYEDEETESYTFDLIPSGVFDIEWLKVKATIGEDSYITIRKPDKELPYRPYAEFNLGFNFELTDRDFGDLKAFKTALRLSETDTIGFGINLNVLGLKINHPDLDGPPKKFIDMLCMCGSSMYIKYGSEQFDLTIDDILKADTILNETSQLVPGLELEFKFKWLIADFGLIVTAEENPIDINMSPDEFPGFKLPPRFKLNFNLDEIGKLPEIIDSLANAVRNFSCKCESEGSGNEIQSQPGTSSSVKPSKFCNPVVIPPGAVATTANTGDLIQVGHFKMKVTASGKGKILIPFLNTEIDVQFNNVSIVQSGNVKYLSSGDVKTTFSDGTPTPAINDLPVNNSFLENLSKVVGDVKKAFSLPFSVREALKAFKIDLPEGADFIFLGFTFTNEGTVANAMLTFKLEEDSYLKFGLEGLNVRPDGINMEQLSLYLAQDFRTKFD